MVEMSSATFVLALSVCVIVGIVIGLLVAYGTDDDGIHLVYRK